MRRLMSVLMFLGQAAAISSVLTLAYGVVMDAHHIQRYEIAVARVLGLYPLIHQVWG